MNPEVLEVEPAFRLTSNCTFDVLVLCNDVLIRVSDRIQRFFFFLVARSFFLSLGLCYSDLR